MDRSGSCAELIAHQCTSDKPAVPPRVFAFLDRIDLIDDHETRETPHLHTAFTGVALYMFDGARGRTDDQEPRVFGAMGRYAPAFAWQARRDSLCEGSNPFFALRPAPAGNG